jgi:elongation factor G
LKDGVILKVKNTVSDFREMNRIIQIPYISSLLYTLHGDYKINLIDTPGLDDFVNGVVSSLHVADAALLLINAQNGVEVGTEIHGRYLSKAEKPMIFVVNHLDHEKVNWEKSIEMLKRRFGHSVIIVQYPANPGSDFNSIIDVLTMKMYRYGKDGGKPEVMDIPADQMEQAKELHSQLIEKAAESEESLMEQFFANDTLTPEEFQKGIKAGLLQRGLFPVFCVSAKKNIGVSRLMEFITQVAPGPDEVAAPKAGDKEIKCSSNGPVFFLFSNLP